MTLVERLREAPNSIRAIFTAHARGEITSEQGVDLLESMRKRHWPWWVRLLCDWRLS